MRPSIISQLRTLTPTRPLTPSEARVIAERQALRFLRLTAVTYPCVPTEAISELPRIEVRRHRLWPSSGAAQWINGRWVIVIKSIEPAGRQKLSLAHELKHIIDHPHAPTLYQHIPPVQRRSFIERQVCDYFAGCLLMPRPWLKRAWTSGVQQLDQLAAMFEVTEAAMATRLNQLGLTEPTPRCARPDQDLPRRAITNPAVWSGYQRSLAPAFTNDYPASA